MRDRQGTKENVMIGCKGSANRSVCYLILGVLLGACPTFAQAATPALEVAPQPREITQAGIEYQITTLKKMKSTVQQEVDKQQKLVDQLVQSVNLDTTTNSHLRKVLQDSVRSRDGTQHELKKLTHEADEIKAQLRNLKAETPEHSNASTRLNELTKSIEVKKKRLPQLNQNVEILSDLLTGRESTKQSVEEIQQVIQLQRTLLDRIDSQIEELSAKLKRLPK